MKKTDFSKKVAISIIIPLFNKEKFIEKSLDSVLNQKNFSNYEIIIIDDGSTDNSVSIIKKNRLKNLKIISIKKNRGVSVARNIGIKHSVGEYIYFFDADDLIDKNALSELYKITKKFNCDYVFSDFKKIDYGKNQRKNIYNYSQDKLFKRNEIKKAMVNELYDPSLGHLGLFGCNGRLIRSRILKKNNIFFDERLRWNEDKTFGWKVLSHIRNARYVRKQLYSYYYYQKIRTAVTDGIADNTSLQFIKIILKIIEDNLKIVLFSKIEIFKLRQQGIIFFSIQALVGISNQIYKKKINKNLGKKIRKKLIKNILQDKEITRSIKNYSCSKKESRWIPSAIFFKSIKLTEIACDLRAREVSE